MTRSNLILFFLCYTYSIFGQVDFDTVVDYDGFFDRVTMDEVVVTSIYDDIRRGKANLSISSLDYSNFKNSNKTLGQLLEQVPGIFIDASIGEVQNRVHSRGISIAAEDDLGWYYMSLMEDGLPISLTQHTFYSPDLFFRMDRNIDKLEVIRGGQSNILSVNAPGGIFNAISKEGSPKAHGVWNVGYGQSGNQRDLINIDLQLDGPLNLAKGLYYNFGLHYRFDQGPRDTNFNFSEGGQLKANLKKVTDKTVYRLRFKYLNDITNRYLGLPATGWKNPEATNGFDFNTSALMLPAFAVRLPDGRNNGTIEYNTEKGIQTNDATLQLDVDHQLGKNILKFKSKYSRKNSNWNTVIGNQPLGLESFLPYFLTGFDNPWGQIDFGFVGSDNQAASINNLGALNAFQGMEPTFDYLNGERLPNDALLGTALWLKDDQSSEWMTRISLEGNSNNHNWNINGFLGLSTVEMYTTASYAFATYEDEPKLLTATLVDPINGNVALSDGVGVSNYNGLFYEDGNSSNTISSLALQDQWNINSSWTIHLGAKIENISYKGSRFLPTQNSMTGGLDNDISTGYDNAALSRGEQENFDDNFTTFNYSLGANYSISKSYNLFFNYANGKKAPELNYYFNTFSGVPIIPLPEVQSINQIELGINHSSNSLNFAVVGFYSVLDNFSSNDFAFDQMNNSIFYTPFQNNKVSVFGVEFEETKKFGDHFNIGISATVQTSNADRFTVYDANDSVDPQDDTVSDFSNNKIAHTPELVFSVRPEYRNGNIAAYANYRYLGSRFGNAENSFELPGFGTFGAGIQYQRGRFTIGLDGTNLLNSKGLLNFFGPDQFGSSANQATAEYINSNPEGRFVVFPTMPRALRLNLGYNF